MSQITFHFNDHYKTESIIDMVSATRASWSNKTFSLYVSAYSKDGGENICAFEIKYNSFKKKGLTFDFNFKEDSAAIEAAVVSDATMKLRPGVAHELENAKGGAEYRVSWIILRVENMDWSRYDALLENKAEIVINNFSIS
jgi:hypothetical protein